MTVVLTLQSNGDSILAVQEFMNNPDLVESWQCSPPEQLSCVYPDSAGGATVPSPLLEGFQASWNGKVVANQQNYASWQFVNALTRNLEYVKALCADGAVLVLPYPVQTFAGGATGPQAIKDKFSIIYNRTNRTHIYRWFSSNSHCLYFSEIAAASVTATLRSISGSVHLVSAVYAGSDKDTAIPINLPMIFVITLDFDGKVSRIEVSFDIMHYTHAVTCQPNQVLGCTLRTPAQFYQNVFAGQPVSDAVSTTIRITSHGKQPWDFSMGGVYNGGTGVATWANLYRAGVVGVPAITSLNVLTSRNGTAYELSVSSTLQPNPSFPARSVYMKVLHILSFDNYGKIATIDEFFSSMDEISVRACPKPTEVLGCVPGTYPALESAVQTPYTPLVGKVALPTAASGAAQNFISKLASSPSLAGAHVAENAVLRLPTTITGFGPTVSGRQNFVSFFISFGASFSSPPPSDSGFPVTIRSADADTAIATSYVSGAVSRSGNPLKTPLVWIFSVDPNSQLITELELWFDVTQWTFRYMCPSTHRLACSETTSQPPVFAAGPSGSPFTPISNPAATPVQIGPAPSASPVVVSPAAPSAPTPPGAAPNAITSAAVATLQGSAIVTLVVGAAIGLFM